METESVNSAQPLQGVCLCCTSIPVDQRTDIAKKVKELGGTYRNDLTPEVTHLVVGDYNTPKYRHVAYERPDIKPVCAGWVDAVLDLWTKDAPIDLEALEQQWQLRAFEAHGGLPAGPDGQPIDRGRLLCSVTGFEEGETRRQEDEREPLERGPNADSSEERQRIIAAIVDNGGVYHGDLTREITHLIVKKPEGNKYVAAMHWGIHAVSVEWLHDCIARGMILEESKYDPRLPPEDRGKDACLARTVAERAAILGKRQREASSASAGGDGAAPDRQGLRKLRKTASRKLTVQRDNLWGDILGKSASAAEDEDGGASRDVKPAQPQPQPQLQPQPAGQRQAPLPPPLRPSPPQPQQPQKEQTETAAQPPSATQNPHTLSLSIFCIHGFSPSRTQILVNAVATMGGHIAATLTDMAVLAGTSLPSSLFANPTTIPNARQHLIVPQDMPATSLPAVSDNVLVVTEFFIEKCLHKKQYVAVSSDTSHDNDDQHQPATASVIGRPFPVFPIPGFDALSICTSGFTGVDLNQIDKAVRQLGARYEERFTAQCSLLLVTALSAVRKPKLELALSWKVPVVDACWLWTCIASGTRQPMDAFLFPQLRQQLPPEPKLEPTPASAPATEPALTVPTLVMGSPNTRGFTAHVPREDGHGSYRENSTERSFHTALGTNRESALAPLAPMEPTAPRRTADAGDEAERQRLLESQNPRRPEQRKPLGRVFSEIADSVAGDSEDEYAAGAGAPASSLAASLRRPEQPSPTPVQQSATPAAPAAPTPRPSAVLGRVASESAVGLQQERRATSQNEVIKGTTNNTARSRGRAGAVGTLSRAASAASLSMLTAAAAAASEERKEGGGRPGRGGGGGDGAGASASVAANGDDGDPLHMAPTQVQVQYLDPEADWYQEQLMEKILGVPISAEEASDAAGAANRNNRAGPETARPTRRSSRLR